MELSFLLPYIEAYKIPAVFFGSFFFGETLILSALFLTIENHWSLTLLFTLTLLGTLLSDIVWFILGKRFLLKSQYWRRLEEKHARYLEHLEEKTPLSQASYLLFFKFLYGTRIITILFVALLRMPLMRFILYDVLGTSIWLLVLILSGRAAWEGVTWVIQTLHITEYALGFGLLLILLYKIFTLWIRKRNEK